ncbi:hypothetical protein KIW84_054703 [Lathyrus oleraceus]|uniref:ATP-dependent DNA helicase n=1 Tax=Pisum sativum TaxID=3888 RepID=A0A9D4WYL4_PEA|nr:hypothetical protein KIW84_054703 [Pisum sativum]
MYVTEFQKRGLPHVHMLLILDTDDKLREPEEYDSVVKAEIPRHESEPELYEAVLKHMIHGSCGVLNQSSPCMKNGHCKKRYPKDFCEETRQGNDSYPEYMRRFSDPIFLNRNKSVDNRWVVPYNPWLLLKYDCHINVEICSIIKSIKYLYKYVYKGPDRVAMEVHRGTGMDDIQQYVDTRWICAPEALWKIFKFTLYKLYPSVERLQIHLPNHHQVRFYKHQRITDVLNDNQNAVTMLTEFFALNQMDPDARNYLYREIPEHYCWLKGVKKWQRRRTKRKVIGRIYTVSPSEGEKFYLRVLLSHLRGPTSWECLLTHNGSCFFTFKKEVEDWGLLESDNSIRECMLEASNMRMPYALRRLFVTILIFCEPTDVRGLFNEFHPYMVEDYQMTNIVVGNNFEDMLLRELRDLLLLHGKLIKNYDLPILTMETNEVGGVPTIIQEELSVQIPDEDIQSVEKLNNDQMSAYNIIMNAIHQKQSQFLLLMVLQEQFVIRIGDGNEPAKEDDMVKMSAEIVIPWEGENSIKKLIQHTFPQLENHGWDASYMVERAILTLKNCDVHMLNDMIINKFPGDEHILLSFDEVEGDTHNLYQQEYLHTIAPGHNAGKRAFLPRIKLKTTDGAGLPFVLIRKQFPVKLSFAITINKSQGQTIPNFGIYLPRHVFSHGQLYVALSKVKKEIFMSSVR